MNRPPSADSSPGASVDRTVRSSTLAGTWYPGEPVALGQFVDALLDEAGRREAVAELLAADARVRGLILPHAGLSWSGPTAACGTALLARADIRRMIILGTAHHLRFAGVSVHRVGAYETPLGRVAVDLPAVERLLQQPGYGYHPEAHAQEHSLEIQLPLLQTVLGEDLRLVPLVISEIPDEQLAAIAMALRAIVDDNTLVVASSDLTHYGDRFGYQPFAADAHPARELERLDRGAIDVIMALDRPAFDDYYRRTGITVCGYQPIRLLLELLTDGSHPDLQTELLDYTTSGAMSGDYSSSVSYAAITFHERRADTLDRAQGAVLLNLARRTIRLAVDDPERARAEQVELPDDAALAVPRAVFVTLRIAGELRGCIGTTVALRPLAAAVVQAAYSAAFEDPRFAPLTAEELERVQLEISVLSPLVPIASPEEIVIGRDGVFLTHGERRGVFLPQVAVEQGWSRDRFLERLAQKAGLPPSPWIADATYQIFQVQVMEEADPPSP